MFNHSGRVRSEETYRACCLSYMNILASNEKQKKMVLLWMHEEMLLRISGTVTVRTILVQRVNNVLVKQNNLTLRKQVVAHGFSF